MQRRAITPYQRRQIAWEQQYRCAGPCERLLPPHYHLDHRVPLFLGGDWDVLSNIQALCGNCHTEKTAFENSFRGKIRRAYEDRRVVLCPWCQEEVGVGERHACSGKAQQRERRVLHESFSDFIQQFRYAPSSGGA